MFGKYFTRNDYFCTHWAHFINPDSTASRDFLHRFFTNKPPPVISCPACRGRMILVEIHADSKLIAVYKCENCGLEFTITV